MKPAPIGFLKPYLLAGSLAAGLPACAVLAPTAGPPPSLYASLGGEDGVANIVDTFVLGLLRDPIVGRSFRDIPPTRLPRLKYLFEQQICEVADGPCRYTGKDMVAAHRGMKVTDAQFDAMGGVMEASLRARGVAPDAAAALLAKLGAMRGDIVGK
ncbi:MAG: group 1 truncated hemoglobin [Alphaproteobacteria bacterium]